MAPLLFVRPGELRQAEWSQFDFDRHEWRYIVSKTKTEHLVPLSTQAVGILEELHTLTGRWRFVFPGRDRRKPMSGAALNAALRRLGFDTKTEITGHGFRAMARTILHERLRFPAEVIEHQLAHRIPDGLGIAYNRTKFLEDRVAMMQAWADYLDSLKAGTTSLKPGVNRSVVAEASRSPRQGDPVRVLEALAADADLRNAVLRAFALPEMPTANNGAAPAANKFTTVRWPELPTEGDGAPGVVIIVGVLGSGTQK